VSCHGDAAPAILHRADADALASGGRRERGGRSCVRRDRRRRKRTRLWLGKRLTRLTRQPGEPEVRLREELRRNRAQLRRELTPGERRFLYGYTLLSTLLAPVAIALLVLGSGTTRAVAFEKVGAQASSRSWLPAWSRMPFMSRNVPTHWKNASRTSEPRPLLSPI